MMAEEAVKALTGIQQYPSYIKPFQENLEKSSEAKGEIVGLEKGMEAGRTTAREKAKAAAESKFAKSFAEAPQRSELEKVSSDVAAPFIPTRDNAQSLAAIFMLTNIAGFAMGAGGKRNAQAAMSGMNGMLEGYQRGRQDLYRKEKDAFDTNIKQLKIRYDMLDRQLKDALETYKTDKQAGLRDAEIAYAQAGADFYKQYADKFGLAAMYEFHKQAKDNADKMWAERNREEERARAQAFREQQERNRAEEKVRAQKIQEEAARKTAEYRAARLAQGAQGSSLKPGAKVTEAYIADNQLKVDIDDLAGEIRRNPRLTEMLKQYRVEAFLSEEGKVLNQLVDEQIPSELRSFLTKVRDMRNNYYLNISGKAVTGGEALRSYGTVPQPGDSPQAMIDKMSGMSNRVSNAISIKRQLYGLPAITLAAGAPTNLVPGETYSIANPQTAAPAAAATAPPAQTAPAQTAPAQTAPAAAKAMPTGERLTAYAKAHFGGDEAKAKAHLSSQGYK